MDDQLRSLVDLALSGDQAAAGDVAMILDEFSTPGGMGDAYAGEPLLAVVRPMMTPGTVDEMADVVATALLDGEVPATAASTLIYALGRVESDASVRALGRLALKADTLDEEAQFQLVCSLERVAYLDPIDDLALAAGEVLNDRDIIDQLERLGDAGSDRVRFVARRMVTRRTVRRADSP